MHPGEGPEEEAQGAWPGEAEEAAFLAAEKDQVAKAPVAAAAASADAAEVAEPGEPPSLEELVGRVPADIRSALDELFRARFTRATRVRAAQKKAGPAGPA